ncbi:MAG TPA: acyltransferase [Stellaceae bacterium]|nr:acyltransferase [Stellaceae bacterium]
MIELYRYILAAAVAQTHLWPLGADWTGQISVFAFYTLSGYLMTRVLNDRYGFTLRGTGAFILNRILRLWPAYLVILSLALVALRFLPLSNFFFLIRMPKNLEEVVTNLTIAGQVTFDFLQWLPLAKPLVTSWSLSIEVCSYVLLAFWFAKSSRRLWMLAALGVITMAISTGWCEVSINPAAYGPYCFQNRYGVIQAGFAPFAFGGLYHFHRRTISQWILGHRRSTVCLISVLVGTMFTGPVVTTTIGPFIGVPLMWMLLANTRDANATKTQDFFGRASYHLFIAHMPTGAVLAIGFHVRAQSIAIYLATLVVSLGLSVFLVPMEHSINKLRRRIARIEQREPSADTMPAIRATVDVP